MHGRGCAEEVGCARVRRSSVGVCASVSMHVGMRVLVGGGLEGRRRWGAYVRVCALGCVEQPN